MSFDIAAFSRFLQSRMFAKAVLRRWPRRSQQMVS